MTYLQAVSLFFILFACGQGFAHYLWYRDHCPNRSTWIQHLYQWWWSLVSAICFALIGRWLNPDTIFSWFGQVSTFFIAPAAGYVIGRFLYWPNRKRN